MGVVVWEDREGGETLPVAGMWLPLAPGKAMAIDEIATLSLPSSGTCTMQTRLFSGSKRVIERVYCTAVWLAQQATVDWAGAGPRAGLELGWGSTSRAL